MYIYTEEDNQLMLAQMVAKEEFEKGYVQGVKDAVKQITIEEIERLLVAVHNVCKFRTHCLMPSKCPFWHDANMDCALSYSKPAHWDVEQWEDKQDATVV